MTRRDYGADADLLGAMRDSYDYIHARDRGAERDNGGSSKSESLFGDPRDLAGLLAGGALVGLMSGLLGNANIGQTGIPNAIIPAGIGYAASYFDLLGRFDRDVKNAATGALIVGAGLWALSQGVRIQAARQQTPAVVVAGGPPPYAAQGSDPRIGHMPPPQAPIHYQPSGYSVPAQHLPSPEPQTRSQMPLSEAELISIAQRY